MHYVYLDDVINYYNQLAKIIKKLFIWFFSDEFIYQIIFFLWIMEDHSFKQKKSIIPPIYIVWLVGQVKSGKSNRE